jgi:peptidoglycan/LPS O-acetylase OafA/YrhL
MPRADLPAPIASVVAGGYSGVSLFFVLSGFILAHVYGEAAAPGRPFPAKQFLIARFARVYPAYLAALVFAVPALVRDLHVRPDAPTGATVTGICLSTVTMVQAWVPGWGCWWNCPGWSLSVEAFFYLSFPLIAPVLLRRRTATLAAVGVSAWLLALVLGAFTVAEIANEAALPWMQFRLPGLTAWTPVVRLPEFVLGMCASRVLRTQAALPRVGMLGGGLAVAVVLAVASLAPSDWSSLLLWPGLSLLYAIVIVALSSPLHRSVLSSRALQRLGNASYSLYLLHAVAQGYLLAAINRTWGPEHAGGWVVFLIYVAIVLTMSILMHDWVEVPARRRLRAALA